MPFPYAGHELSGVDLFLETHLLASASLLALLGGPFVFAELAPESQPPPFVTYQMLSAPDVNAIGADARLFVRVLYLVKAITAGNSVVPGEQMAAAVDAALLGQTGPVPTANILVGPLFREEMVRYTEVLEGVRWNHVGGRWRSMVSAL